MATKTRYHIGGYVPAAPAQNRAEEWDSAAGTYTAWDPAGVQTASRALTSDEAASLAAADTNTTAANNQTSIRQQAATALTADRAYLGLASPTNVQVAAQVRSLTQQMIAVLRLQLGQFDDVT